MPIGVTLAPYLPLEEGVEIGGRLVDFRQQQRKDYDSDRPLYLQREAGKASKSFEPFAPDGTPNEPIYDWVFTVDTGQPHEQTGETERRIFLDPRKGARGTAVEGLRGKDAIERAVAKAGANRVGLELGGSLWITRGPKVAPRRGEAACVTYTARYEPPADGPGTGRQLDDETIWLVGGKAWDPNEREPKPAILDTTPAAPVDSPVDQPNPIREVVDQLARAHASSPVLNKPTEQQPAFDDEPPF